MHDLDLLVPSALVEPALAKDLGGSTLFPLPNLSRAASRANAIDATVARADAPLEPWQAWLFGADANSAETRAAACGATPRRGRWLLEPAHYAVARDHLRLDDPAALVYSIDEARALAASIEPLLADDGWRLDLLEPATLRSWFVARDDGLDLEAPAIERAVGANAAAWQPRGAGPDGTAAALAWRRTVNEVQMVWFDHPVNVAREARGDKPVNTIWLSGNGRATSPPPAYRAVDSGLDAAAALPIDPGAARTLTTFDALVAPARGEDWFAWREALAALDAQVGRALDGLVSKTLASLAIVLCGATTTRTIRVVAKDLGRFRLFRKPADLPALLADA